MKTNAIKTSLTVKTNLKAGGLSTVNHNRPLKIRSAVKAGGLSTVNHSRLALG
jgi:hypothetical protein